MSANDQSLREHLLSLMQGRNAHISFDDFVADFPVERCGQKIEGLPYTAWQVLEHMRIAQWDILEFCRNPKHVSPKWPEGYWPKPSELGSDELWQKTIAKFRDDGKQLEDLTSDPNTDLFAKIAHGSGQTLLREVLLVADHNAYHLGVLVVADRILKTKS